ncbi:MAG: YdcF family protein [Hormoscilla sp.]
MLGGWRLLVLLPLLWFGSQQIFHLLRPPQAMLVLGGALERERFAAEFARDRPNVQIWVSGGSNREYAQWLFSEAGVDLERLHLDYRATDTVTNFTSLADDLKAQGIDKIYLITSDDHMRRARVIATIVLGSRSIEFKPVPVPSGREPEPIEKAVRDGVRAVLWLATGHSGARLRPYMDFDLQSVQ